MLISTNKRFSELYGYYNKGIMALLKWWGDPEQLMDAYVKAIEEQQRKVMEEQERIEREEKEKARKQQEERERAEQEEKDRKKREREEQKRMLRQSQQESMMAGAMSEDGKLMIGYENTENGA